MTNPCRLLLIEDDNAEAAAIEKACCPDPASAAIVVVGNGAEAEEAIRGHDFDLIICDLALPTDARRFDPDVAEGLRLFKLLQEHSVGTPVIVLSGHANLHMMRTFFDAGRQADLYGTGTEQPLVQFFPKEDLPDCVEAVKAHIARIGVLDAVELRAAEGLTLSLSETRALKIYARRTGAARVVVQPLSGGLSDSKTLRVDLYDRLGAGTGAVVVKLGLLRNVAREADRYSQIAARLPVGVGALVLHVVQAGAGQTAALVYQMASPDQYTSTLLALLANRDARAASAVRRLVELLAPWLADAPIAVKSLTEIRRPHISDLQLMDAGVDYAAERDVEVTVRESTSHGDLHGLNILVTTAGEPTLIDYGEVRRANAALDPVTLELSAVFHPAILSAFAGWPSLEQARQWTDLDAYCVDCPIEDFIRACRTWAEAVSHDRREMLATAYAYAIRQVKYGTAALPVATQIVQATLEELRKGLPPN